MISVESPGALDTCFDDFPLHQALGDQIHTRFTPLRQYEGFASDVTQRAGIDAKYEEEKAILKEGLLYLLTFTVEYDPGILETKRKKGVCMGTAQCYKYLSRFFVIR